MTRAAAERRGRRAELIAALWLQLHGWRVLARRARTPVGEVDLVVRRGRTVAFVEVKTRDGADALGLAIDRRRLTRVAAAANALAARFAKPTDTIRIDVVLVAPRRLPQHLKNVWHG